MYKFKFVSLQLHFVSVITESGRENACYLKSKLNSKLVSNYSSARVNIIHYKYQNLNFSL